MDGVANMPLGSPFPRTLQREGEIYPVSGMTKHVLFAGRIERDEREGGNEMRESGSYSTRGRTNISSFG
jgi:hypothetical protein